MTILHRTKLLFIFSLICVFLTACNTGYGRSANVSLETLSITENLCSPPEVLDIGFSPSFSSDERRYTAVVSQLVSSVSVGAIAEDDGATVRINGLRVSAGDNVQVDLSEGLNNITVEVTAENERTREYRVAVTRSSISAASSALSSLGLEYVELEETFSPSTLEYTAEPNFFVNSTRVTASAEDSLATVRLTTSALTNEVLLDLEPSSETRLSTSSEEDFSIEVNACTGSSDGTTTYSIQISRAAPLALEQANYIKSSESDAGDLFGDAIAFDGTTLVVGAPQQGAYGAVYTFRHNGVTWVEEKLEISDEQSGERFGTSVAVAGDLIVVGSPGFGGNQGRVRYFEYDSGSEDWDYESELTLDSGSLVSGSNFGESVSTSGEYIIVGAPGDINTVGRVYVFELDGNDWEEQTDTILTGRAGNMFGKTVAFNMVSVRPEFLVSAPEENSQAGESSVYQLENNDWIPFQLASSLEGDALGANDGFGSAIAIEGNRLLIGAPGDDSSANNANGSIAADDDETDSGAVYVFERENETDDWEFVQFLKASRDSGLGFGSSVALSASMVVVGAPFEDGDSNEVSPISEADDSPSGENDSGAVFVFEVNGSGDSASWSTEVYGKADNVDSGDEFGSAVAFYGEYLFVAAPNEQSSANGVTTAGSTNNSEIQAGAVYLIQ